MARKKQPAATQVKAEPSIYIGPSLPNGQLNKNTIFKFGVLLPHIEKLIHNCPAIKHLIVPTSKLSTAQAKLSDRSSPESAWSKEILNHFIKGVKQ